MDFLHSLHKTTQGQSVARTAMNQSFRGLMLKGKVLDIGGARNPDYFSYFKQEGVVSVEAIDGSFSGIDFEKDRLPYEDGSQDTVLLCNVLEHIFNYDYVLAEAFRVTKQGGAFIGFVPFLVYVHPDPHDYFRYTEETLQRIVRRAGFTEVTVTPVGKGPFLVGCNTVIRGLPKVLRPLWFSLSYFLDVVYEWRSKKGSVGAFPLGYTFSGIKK